MTPDREKLLARLAKLKALSECKTGNVHETATAAALMTRLMLEHQIEIEEVPGSGAIPIVERDLSAEVRDRGYPLWQVNLLALVARATDCLSYEVQSGESQFRLRLLGTEADIAQARSLYCFCHAEVERLGHLWNPDAPNGRKNDFRRGAGHAIGQKMARERFVVIQESRAMVHMQRKREAVEARAAQLGLVAKRKKSHRHVLVDDYNAGYLAASDVDADPTPPRDLEQLKLYE